MTETARRRRLIPGVLGAGLAVLLGTGAWAAATARGPGGWHGRGHAEHAREHFRAMLERALDEIGASETQRAQILEIAERTGAELEALHPDRRALREELTARLSAPSIDREALERLRSEHLASIESASQVLVAALADAADVLTPEQRVQLAELHRGRWERFGRRHGEDSDVP
jgi:Spy/CpxP family protein refolding chaperone